MSLKFEWYERFFGLAVVLSDAATTLGRALARACLIDPWILMPGYREIESLQFRSGCVQRAICQLVPQEGCDGGHPSHHCGLFSSFMSHCIVCYLGSDCVNHSVLL